MALAAKDGQRKRVNKLGCVGCPRTLHPPKFSAALCLYSLDVHAPKIQSVLCNRTRKMPKEARPSARRVPDSYAVSPRRLQQLAQLQTRARITPDGVGHVADAVERRLHDMRVQQPSARPFRPQNIRAVAAAQATGSSTPSESSGDYGSYDSYGSAGMSATPRVSAAASQSSRYKVLGSGSYGCTLEPSFSCTDPAASAAIAARQLPGKRYVSKLLSKTSHMAKEEAQYLAVAVMDPHGLFTVPMLGTCMARPELADFAGTAADGRSPKCGSAGSNLAKTWDAADGQLPQIVYEHGGVNLDQAAEVVPMQTLLAAMTPVMAGLASIAAYAAGGQYFFHRDIKPANIVYADSCSRLIDFGLSVADPQQLYSPTVIGHTYMFYPPELDLYYFMIEGRERRTSNRGDAYASALRDLFASDPSEPALDVQAQYGAMKAEVMRHMRPPGQCTAEELTPYWVEHFSQKFDLFGVGIVVICLINDCRVRNVDPALLNRIRSWAEAATHFNAFQRFTPQRAQEEWLKIWPPHLLVDVERRTAARAGVAVGKDASPSLLAGVWTRFKQWLWPGAAGTSRLGGVKVATTPRRRRSPSTTRRRTPRRRPIPRQRSPFTTRHKK